MAISKKSLNMDLGSIFENAGRQFSELSWENPGTWPLLPKIAAWLAMIAAVLALIWLVLISGVYDELELERGKEAGLKADYQSKLSQAVNLEELRKQKLQVEEYVTQLEKQLPGKAEMDALLSDINQAGLGRGLQFEFFKPGDFVVKDYYGEKLISIKVLGRYHDIGAFAADIANLSRIVTLHNMSIMALPQNSPGAGQLTMEATARAYRYLDAAEIEKVQQDKRDKAKGGQK